MTSSSAILGSRTSMIGTSLGGGSYAYPDGDLFWATGLAPGWPGADRTCFDQHTADWGRQPDLVRIYQNSPDATTGVGGSAGSYGFFSSDTRSIMNAGAVLVITWKILGRSWAQIAADLAPGHGANATTAILDNIAQNWKRWRDDTGNTAPLKKFIGGFHHEPSNDPGLAADYVLATQRMIDYFKTKGIGAGLAYDVIEWAHVPIMYDLRPAAGEYAYYPGDAYTTWVLADGYNWAGGQTSGATSDQVCLDAMAGKVPQPGRTITKVGHYSDGWKTMQAVCKPLHDWYYAHSTSGRDVLLGIGEWSSGEDIDRFTVSGGVLANPKVHTGKPHLKGDFFEGMRKYLRGEAYTAPDSENSVTADAFGRLLRVICHFNSQTGSNTWWHNSVPFQPGDTTAPSTAGAARSYTRDKFVTLVNDDIFVGTPTPHTPPTLNLVSGAPLTGDPNTWDFGASVIPGDGAIVSWTWNPGDGSGPQVHTSALLSDLFEWAYPTSGNYTVTLDVVDANGLHATYSGTITVSPPSNPAVTKYAHAPYLVAGTPVDQLRTAINAAYDALDTFAETRGSMYPLITATGGFVWTNQPAAVTQFSGAPNKRLIVDLSGYTKVRGMCSVSTAGVTGAALAPYYSVDGGTTWRAFDGSATSGAAVTTTLAGATVAADTVGPHVGAYIGIPSEAQIDGVQVKWYGAGGDGVADPAYEAVGMLVR